MKKAIALLAVLPLLLTAGSALADAPSKKDKRGLGLKPTPLTVNVPKYTFTGASAASVVTSYDLSANLPPVGDQGPQGSCVAWATGYYAKSYGTGNVPSYNANNLYSPAFIYNSLNGGVDNGLSAFITYYFLFDSGATTLSKMPYNPYDYLTKPNAAQIADAALHKNPGFANIFLGAGGGNATSRQAVKDALLGTNGSHKLVTIALPVYPGFDNATASDSYVITPPQSGESSRGGHMVTIVGFDDNKPYNGGVGAFKIVNSWGTGWGNKGFSWISYNFFQNTATEAWTM